MAVNIGKIELVLAQKIDNSTSNLELITYSKAIEKLRNTGVFYSDTFTNLPNYNKHVGELWYVDQDETVYISLNLYYFQGWVPLVNEGADVIWAGGLNTCGRLGNGTTVNTCSPIREISSTGNWRNISSGCLHSSAIKLDGSLWLWGESALGRLGNGRTVGPQCSPIREITSSTNWCCVSASFANTAAIKTDNTLWTWGCGASGQLGNGATVNRCSPVREISNSSWRVISVGYTTMAAIKTDNTLWTWGGSAGGILGNGTTTTNRCSPVREISSSTNWCTVSNGCLHSAAIKTDGTLWSWGCNLNGRLGDSTTVCKCSPVREITSSTNWCLVSTGSGHTAAIKSDGSLWSWGLNSSGELGTGTGTPTATSRCSPVREITSSTNWCLVSSTTRTGSIALKTDGSLWSWGVATSGALLDGTTSGKCSPVRDLSCSNAWVSASAGNLHTLALKFDGI